MSGLKEMKKMIIKECYEAMGENYNEVLARLQLEKLIVKYALKFLDDPKLWNACGSMERKRL